MIVIFGAGHYGQMAYQEIKRDDVWCFIDNSNSKIGKQIDGKPIYKPEQIVDKKESVHVIIASIYVDSMMEQLDRLGFVNYSVYTEQTHGYYDSDELIVNPYSSFPEAKNEQEWIYSEKQNYARQAGNTLTTKLLEEKRLFNHIEIETVNRCNGVCSFCPVNKNVDPRIETKMSVDMFENIIAQLTDINYSGRLSLFSNNEPLLDERIVDFSRYARKCLPHARIHMFTNGTLLTLDKFIELIECLDEMIIDNYHKEQKLLSTVEVIKNYCEDHPKLKKKVSIVLRKPDEIRTTRGGNSPNRNNMPEYPKDKCVLPFKQLIIRPTGQVSLCCNDALGKYTLGDLNKESILDIWYGSKFQVVRECLAAGRENWGDCKYCDTFGVG